MTVDTMSVAEAAARLGVSVDWYSRRLCQRRLPGHKIGRAWRLTEADLQAALDATFSEPIIAKADPAGLSPRSRKALSRKGRSA